MRPDANTSTHGRVGSWISSHPRLAISITSSFLVLYPPLYAYLKAGHVAVFSRIRGDALLYLTIARRSEPGFFSFDGETATNGFHPLWQWILTGIIASLPETNFEAHQTAAFFACAAATTLGVVLCGLAIHRYTDSVFLSLLPIPGVYYMAAGVLYRNLDTWQSIIGMESAMSTATGGALLYVMAKHMTREDLDPSELTRPSRKNPLFRMGLLLPFLVLTRLDDVFVVFGLLAVVWWLPGTRANRLRTIFLVGMPTGASLVAYLLYNHVTVGAPMPLSGASKGGFSAPSTLYIFLVGLFPPVLDLKNALIARQSDGLPLYHNMFRAVELLYPVFIVAAYATVVHRYWRSQLRFVVPLGLGIGVVIKGLYNLIYVNLWHQSAWYYAFAVLLSSFLVAIALGEAYRALRPHATVLRIVHAAYAFFALATAGQVAMQGAYASPNLEQRFCRDREGIAAALAFEGRAGKLLEFDDGVAAFCLDLPAIHGFGFAVDKASHEAKKQGRLLRHAHGRGHDLFVSVGYLEFDEWLDSSDRIREELRTSFLDSRTKAELDDFDFEMIYLHRATGTGFIRFHPRVVVGGSALPGR